MHSKFSIAEGHLSSCLLVSNVHFEDLIFLKQWFAIIPCGAALFLQNFGALMPSF